VRDSVSDTSAERLSADGDDTARRPAAGGDPGPRGPAGPAQAPGPGQHGDPRGRVEQNRLHVITSRYALVLVWLAVAVLYYVLMPGTFGSWGAVRSIFGGQPVLVFLAMSALITLMVGEFDLSIAAIMGLAATIVPVLAGLHGVNIWLACVVALAACALVGAVNAFFVVRLDVSSLVVTLGAGTLVTGISQAISSSNVVSVQDRLFRELTGHPVLGMPVSFYYGLALTLGIAYIMGYTPLGRHMLFVGANREVARLAGIRVERIRVGAYIISSLVAGMAGLIIVSTLGGFDSGTAMQYLLPALAAVFLGTAVVHPGRFNPIGTLIAIYFLWTGIFGLQLLGFAGWIQNVFYGAGLVVAVALAKIVRNRSKVT
jgi:Ribose/xylose/arabinose/galactoside ABC-type transport systems, permease components